MEWKVSQSSITLTGMATTGTGAIASANSLASFRNVGQATLERLRTSYDESMKLSLTGTDMLSKLLLAAPDGRTLGGLWWGISSACLWLVVIVFVASGQWAGLFFVPPAVWSASRAVAQTLRGKL